MEVECSLLKNKINWDLLRKRFPEIAYQLSYGSYDLIECFIDSQGFENAKTQQGFLHEEDVAKEILDWRSSFSLEGVDVLYVYGTGLGHYYHSIKSWLHEKKERVLVFFEEDLSVLDALFQLEIGLEILSDSQVHCYYLPNESFLSQKVEECLDRFISDRVEWSVLRSYVTRRKKSLQSWREKLLRRSSSVHAGVGEALHYHRLLKNITANLAHVPRSFHVNRLKGAFKGIPAVICGAGVSLSKEASKLKTLEQKALVFACGSAITALGHYGIRPHFSAAVDPNEEEYCRLKTSSCFETPFVYSSRIHQDVLDSTNMQMGYLCSETGGVFEAWMHENLGIDPRSIGPELGNEALSVTTLAVALAQEMGCSPILFCGVDLSYGGLDRYCPGVMASSRVNLEDLARVRKSSDQLLRRKNGEGKFVYTLVKWVMEASCIGSYAKKHPQTQFFNVTSSGLPIANAPVISMEEFIKTYCFAEYDLRGKIRAESEMASLKEISTESIQASFRQFYESLERALPLFEEMIECIEHKKEEIEDHSTLDSGILDSGILDSGKMSVLEMDLQEEVSYEVCLGLLFSVYGKLLEWWHPVLDSLDSKEGKSLCLQKKKYLWEEGRKVTLECISLFKTILKKTP